MGFFKRFMVKYFWFLFCGILLFSAAGTGVLFYFNNYYFAESSQFTIKNITSVANSTAKTVKVTLENGATNPAFSHDGRYIAYIKNGSVQIIDRTTGLKTEVEQPAGMRISDFKWVYDRDSLALAEISNSSDSGYYAKMYNYEVKNKTLTEIQNNNDGANQEVKILLGAKTDEIKGIDISTEMVLTYLKITDKNSKSKIWKINIMSSEGDKKQITTETKNIGKILCLKTDDILLYESLDDGKIYRSDTGRALSVNGSTSLKLVGYDSEDNVYFAKMSGEKATALYYGNLTEKNWKTIEVNKTAEVDNFFVSYSGGVYQYNNTTSVMTDLKTSEKIAYTGEFAGSYDSGFFTNNGNTIEEYKFSDMTDSLQNSSSLSSRQSSSKSSSAKNSAVSYSSKSNSTSGKTGSSKN